MRKPSIVDVATIACAVSAMSIAGVVVQRELTRGPTTIAEEAPQPVNNWDDLTIGARIGPETAPVTIVEFGDFECPACKRFTSTIDELMAKYPGSVTVVYRHFPLAQHRFALPTARLAECARKQAPFDAVYTTLYRMQDSLGLITFDSLAMLSGVRNLEVYRKCVADPGLTSRIMADKALGVRVGVTGTPTVLVNGVNYHGMPSAVMLDSVIRTILSR